MQLSTNFDWSIVLDVGVGVGVFLIGLGIFIAMLALARTFRRLNGTLDGVDVQVAALGTPVGQMLGHVSGITETADRAVNRLSGVVKSLEDVSSSAARTADLAQRALAPSIVNLGAAIGGITAGVRRLVRGSEAPKSLE